MKVAALITKPASKIVPMGRFHVEMLIPVLAEVYR